MRPTRTSRAVRRLLAVSVIGAVGALALTSMGFHAARATASASTTIVSITTNTCSGDRTCGTLTVSGAVSGETVTVGIYGKNPAEQFSFVGRTTTINLVSGQNTYNFCISLSSRAAAKKILRVQVVGTSGGTFTGTTTKGPSFQCGEVPGPSPSPSPSASPSPKPSPSPSASPPPKPSPSPSSSASPDA